MHYIRIVRLIIFCLLLPLAVQAKREKVDMPDKPVVSDSILQCIFQFSPFYSRIIDEYKADLYIKGKVKVHKRNHLIRYVPSMFRFEKHINDYLMESLSELHYTAPDIYDRKIKAVSTTFPRNRGQITDVMDYLNMNIYSSSLMSDKLLSPLDKKSSRYYHYLLDSIAGSSDCGQTVVRRMVPTHLHHDDGRAHDRHDDAHTTNRNYDLKPKSDSSPYNSP